jgi:hypothetical protein
MQREEARNRNIRNGEVRGQVKKTKFHTAVDILYRLSKTRLTSFSRDHRSGKNARGSFFNLKFEPKGIDMTDARLLRHMYVP